MKRVPPTGGYVPIKIILDRVGRELYPNEWSGEAEQAVAASSVLIERNRMLQKVVGGGINYGTTTAREDDASKRYEKVRFELLCRLECERLKAGQLSRRSGKMHAIPREQWRINAASFWIDRAVALGTEPDSDAEIYIIDDASELTSQRPLPQARIGEAARLLRTLKANQQGQQFTREQQKHSLRQSFPTYNITKTQFAQIFQAVPTKTGRPRKTLPKTRPE